MAGERRLLVWQINSCTSSVGVISPYLDKYVNIALNGNLYYGWCHKFWNTGIVNVASYGNAGA